MIMGNQHLDWPRKLWLNISSGAMVVTWLCLVSHSQAASHCFGCNETVMDCNDDNTVCRSRCETKVACDNEDSFCMLATYPDPNASTRPGQPGGGWKLLAELQCYPSVQLHYTDVTPHYCGLVQPSQSSVQTAGEYEDGYAYSDAGPEAGFVTCMCTHDYCNDAVYLEGAQVPKLPPVEGPGGGAATPKGPSSTPNHLGNPTDGVWGGGAATPKTPAKGPSSTPNDLGNPTDAGGLTRTHVIVLGVSLSCAALVVVLAAVVVGCRAHVRRVQDGKAKPPTESTSLDLTTEDSDVKVIGQDTPSESPVHVRGDFLPVSLRAVIGRGRFGEVWLADLGPGRGRSPDQEVAVKIFREADSGSWSVEKEMFTDESVMLKHDNVVEFVAAEVRQQGSYDAHRQFWLVTRYYPKGSLYLYLRHHTVNWQELCRLAGTAARGVAHLHADVYGPHGLHKIPLAHRDLKSSNVLVKEDGTCAIADFGLSIQLDPSLSIDQLANSGQAGTPRYMAPEALESKVNLHDVESFKQMDVYSLSLVVWEIAKRCTVGDVVTAEPEHVLPFFDSAPGRASIDDMKTVVSQQRERPGIPTSWTDNTGMQLVAATMEDCWDNDPEARLTAHCVQARFTELITWAEGEQNPGHNDINTITVV